MQGAHDWYETLATTYDKLGYTTSWADPCICYKKQDGEYTLVDTYTDNVFGASTTETEAEKRKSEIGKEWEIKDIGDTEYFLGTQVQQDLALGMIRLTQRPYWEHVITRFDLEHIFPRNSVSRSGPVRLYGVRDPNRDQDRLAFLSEPKIT